MIIGAVLKSKKIVNLCIPVFFLEFQVYFKEVLWLFDGKLSTLSAIEISAAIERMSVDDKGYQC